MQKHKEYNSLFLDSRSFSTWDLVREFGLDWINEFVENNPVPSQNFLELITSAILKVHLKNDYQCLPLVVSD